MKRLISILFILLMSVQLLPALIDIDQKQRTVLASTTEEETHGATKLLKEKKEFKEFDYLKFSTESFLNASVAYIQLKTMLTEPPCLGITTPPPNQHC